MAGAEGAAVAPAAAPTGTGTGKGTAKAGGKAAKAAPAAKTAEQAAEATEPEEAGAETGAEETESTEGGEGGSGSAEGEEGSEGDSAAEGEEEEGGAEASEEDAQEYEVDGERVTLAELKEAQRYLPQAVEAYKKGKAFHEAAQKMVGSIVENTGPALLDLFSARLKGDRDSAYKHLIKVCSAIINEHLEYEEMPEDRREAIRWKGEAEAAREEARQIKEEREKEAQKTQQEEGAKVWGVRISQALKTAGIEADQETVDDVADVIVEGRETGREIPVERAVQTVKRERAKSKGRDWKKVQPEEIPDEDWNRIQAAKLKKHRGWKPAARVVEGAGGEEKPKKPKPQDPLEPLI
jgi:hypothetical protein